MLHVIQSNKMEVLQGQLIHKLVHSSVGQDAFEQVLTPDTIIVQSPGMAQWLKIDIANILGIAANLEFPLPSSYIWQLYQQYFDDLPDTSAFTKSNMAWKLMSLLEAFLDTAEFSEIRAYLDDDDGIKRYQLCQKIADVFDQYQVYRPDWINEWETGNSTIDDVPLTSHQWQPILWRALVEKTAHLGESAYHRANLHQQLLSRITSNPVATNGKPLYIFGISTLPQQQLDVFEALAQHREVYLFWCNPSHHYWGDIVDQQQFSRLKLKQRPETAQEVGYFDIGNPLLASWGKPGRDYLDMIVSCNAQIHDEFQQSSPQSAPETLLQWLQHEIFELTMRGTHERLDAQELLSNGIQYPKLPIATHDRSLQFHKCHSKVRELEVLHDHLLHAFSLNPDLKPADIVVMMPDVAAYAPYIEGVFGSAQRKHFIPYGISDRNAMQESAIVESFLQLMDIHQSRLSLSELLSLLEIPAIQRRFDINDSDYQNIRFWLAQSGYRWGWDGQDKTRWQLPDEMQNTLLFGLQRLLAGYAMPSDQYFTTNSEFRDAAVIAPFHDIEGQEAAALGKLYQFAMCIHDVLMFCASDDTLANKASQGLDFIEMFYDVDDNEQVYLNQLRQALESITHHQRQYPDPINHDIFVAELQQNLQDKGVGQRFMAGAVNFCTLMPMRSIPFQHVCLLGMNDDAYPRQTVPIGFDLMRKAQYRRGDRSRRQDDRYLFLEALLSARTQLYISYIGLNVRDNSARNPSILISELLEYCAQVFCFEGEHSANPQRTQENLLDALQTEHGLQPFDPKYYLASHPITSSFNLQWRNVLDAQRAAPETEVFLQEALPDSADSRTHTLALTELLAFYDNPIKFFLKHRFGATLDVYADEIQDDEPFAISPLDRYLLTEQALHTQGMQDDNSLRTQLSMHWRAAGKLATGRVGDDQFEQEMSNTESFREQVQQYITDVPQQGVEINLSLANVTLEGWLNNGFGDQFVLYRPGKLKTKNCLALWIKWLTICAQHPGRFSQARFIATDKTFVLNIVEQQDAIGLLESLFQQFEKGQNSPLMLFPETAVCWLKSEDKVKTLRIFYGDNFAKGEGQDENIQRVCAQLERHFDGFLKATELIVAPMLNYGKKV
ncbi:exodeoxyribonuclease V subunit gamma [Aliiglaciecola litoralis]|uniref:RecBCD enzyme subunit RecC n=1 Tax=Aliiglaciecola litoralis TaxID=582857 RepID=A0ABN1LL87_9ALTE